MVNPQVVFGGIALVVILIFLATTHMMNRGGPVVLTSSDGSSGQDQDPLGIESTPVPPPPAPAVDEIPSGKNEKNREEIIKKKKEDEEQARLQEELQNLDTLYGIKENWLDDTNQTSETTVERRVTAVPMAKGLREFSRSPWETVRESHREIMCSILIMGTKNCNPWTETLVSCILKLGMKNLQKILADRCTHSSFWRETLPKLLKGKTANDGVDESEDAWKKLKRGAIWDATIVKTSEKESAYPYIPPEQRDPSPFPGPRVCSNGCRHYPMGFGVPLSSFETSVPRTKNFQWMPLMPKATPAQGAYEARVEEEDFFRAMYAQSFFAFAHQRGGFICLRELEILSAGTIPFYWDIDRLPRNTMGNFPLALMRQAMDMPGVSHIRHNGGRYTRGGMHGGINFNRHGDIERSNDPQNPKFNLTRYYELADAIHAYSRKYLTTRSIVAYMLKVLDAENAKTAIIFTRSTNDYTEMTVIHGLGDLGIEVTVVSAQDQYDFYYMRSTPDGTMTRQERDNWLRPQHQFTYGAAYGFSSRYNDARIKRPWVRNPHDVLRDIKAKKFDVALWQLTGQYYEYVQHAKEAGTKIGFLQFRDLHGDPDSSTMQACGFGGPIFIREMSDRHC